MVSFFRSEAVAHSQRTLRGSALDDGRAYFRGLLLIALILVIILLAALLFTHVPTKSPGGDAHPPSKVLLLTWLLRDPQ